MTDPNVADPTDDQAAALIAARIRRMMLVAALTTGLGITAVLVAIGYRLFRGEGSVVAADLTERLPKGAKILSTAIAGERIVVTLDTDGVTEIRTFDLRTLKASGRLRFATEP